MPGVEPAERGRVTTRSVGCPSMANLDVRLAVKIRSGTRRLAHAPFGRQGRLLAGCSDEVRITQRQTENAPVTSLLIFCHRAQQLPVATSTREIETEKPQAVSLRRPIEHRLRKPMLYPLSYEGARA